MHALLFANGELKRGVMLDRTLASLDSPRVICADGGALHARALGLTPHTIIGDLDSLTDEEVERFVAAGAEVIQYPPHKDQTDLELALQHCRELDTESLSILGALGGRIDQTLANIQLLALPSLRRLRATIVDGAQAVRLLPPGQHLLRGAAGDTISLLPMSPSVSGITTQHLKYPLRNETLALGPARGISNVMLADEAAVSLKSGLLLLVHTVGRA